MRFPNVLAVYTFLFFFATISIDTIIPFLFYFFWPASRRFWYSGKKKITRGDTIKRLGCASIPEFRWRKLNTCELRVTTAEFDCTHLFVTIPLSLSLSLYDALCMYVCVCTEYYIQPTHTHTHDHSIRQSVCFVTILSSFVRAIKRVSCSFYSNHSILFQIFFPYSLLFLQACCSD